jgi:hypothetical protein
LKSVRRASKRFEKARKVLSAVLERFRPKTAKNDLHGKVTIHPLFLQRWMGGGREVVFQGFENF